MTDADAAPCSVGVVVVAAGSGTRLGAQRPKAFVELAGRPLLGWALDPLRALRRLTGVVVVVPPGLEDASDPAWERVDLPEGALVVAGGASRTDSVGCGLRALPGDCEIVLVHDAARCLTPIAVFERVVAAVADGADAAIPGLPVVDTIKAVDDAERVTATVDRSRLRAVQTPQAFRREVLEAAHASGDTGTDDAAIVERSGGSVVVVAGDHRALKVTGPHDLQVAEALVAMGRGGAS